MLPKCNIPKHKCNQNANNTETQMSPKQKCHQKANVTKMLISPIELIFVFLYLPNELGKIRSPDLVHINPNGLPGRGLSDSRLVIVWSQFYLSFVSAAFSLASQFQFQHNFSKVYKPTESCSGKLKIQVYIINRVDPCNELTKRRRD